MPECSLICHPESVCTAVGSFGVAVHADMNGIGLRYTLAGDLDRLRVPPPGTGERRDGLWRHTCFELFVTMDGAAYHEFNLSPSGAWQAYRFARYREQGGDPPQHAPQIAVSVEPGCLILHAHIPAAALPALDGGRWRAGVCAVIEDAAGVLSYWAVRHAAGKPDFHHRDAFAIAL